MINEYDKGGLKMIDMQSFNTSLKVKWVQNYFNTDNNGKWISVFDYYLKIHGGKLLFQRNLKQKDLPKLKDPFLRESIELWIVTNFEEKHHNLIFSLIWHNSLIRIENRPIFYESWFSAGVKEIRDLLDEDNTFVDKLNLKTISSTST